MAETLVVVVCGVAGLAIGSFLNVVVYRVPLGLSLVSPPSRCPACEHRLTALDMVPVVSWLVLRGRCRHCGAPVSARYPVIEVTTGAVFAGAAAAIGLRWLLVPVLLVAACALAAAILDAEGADPPVVLPAVSLAAGLALLPVAAGIGEAGMAGWAGVGMLLAAAAAMAVDRTPWRLRLRRVAVLAALGSSAGVLWAFGGPFAAAWIVVAAAGAGLGASRRPPLTLLVAGAFAAVVASGAISRP